MTVSMNLLLLFVGFCMNMDPICSFENLAPICQITRRHTPDDKVFKILVGIFKMSSNFRPIIREKVNKDRKYTYKVALKRFHVFTSFNLIQWGHSLCCDLQFYIDYYVMLCYLVLCYVILYYITLYFYEKLL
jgi:hypothetical protein